MNHQKCDFGKEKLMFLGHIINRESIRADPGKVTAITEMKAQQMCPNFVISWGWRTNWELSLQALQIGHNPSDSYLAKSQAGFEDQTKPKHSERSKKSYPSLQFCTSTIRRLLQKLVQMHCRTARKSACCQ